MATLSITVPDASVMRIRSAVAQIAGVPAPATNAQISTLVRQYLRSLCIQVESQQRVSTAAADATSAVEAEFPAE